MLRCRPCQEGPQLDFGSGTVDLAASHRAGSRDDQPLGLRGWTVVAKEWLKCFSSKNWRNGWDDHQDKLSRWMAWETIRSSMQIFTAFRGCEIGNPLLFMQGCESALRSSRAHWKAHLWTQALISHFTLVGNFKRVIEIAGTKQSCSATITKISWNLLTLVVFLLNLIFKWYHSLGKQPWRWQVALELLSSMESWHLRCTPLSSSHQCGSNRNGDWELVRLMDWWTSSSKIAWKSLPCLIQTKCAVELLLNDLTHFVLESEHLKISSQKMPKSQATNLQWWPRPPLRLATFWEPWRLSMWRKKLPQKSTKHWWHLLYVFELIFLICRPSFCGLERR